ncbi:MAG: exodeoxyribonuclease VII large subunit, partial [Clostridia bacterium]|nr:exodeoxyribonuclease VII large subunit [Clostridia bacterium]
PAGAAVQDVVRMLGRRFPFAGVVLYPALVQGEDAPPTLIAGINCFNRLRNVDLIIIGRGGGSAEDLFAFQDESLVRAVANSAIPVISAVGHETDFTLCDFAADLRAPTPSAAAELAVPETKTLIKQFSDVLTTMARLCTQKMNSARQKLDALAQRKVLSDGKGLYREQLLRLNAASAGLDNAVRKYLDRQASAFTSQSAKLEALSPLAVLNRGYAVALKNGTPVRTVEALSVGDAVTIRLRDGTADVSVDKIGKERENNG